MESRGPWRGPIGILLLVTAVIWTAARVAAAQIQWEGRQSFWKGEFREALASYHAVAWIHPAGLDAAKGKRDVYLNAMESPQGAASRLGMDFQEAAGRCGEELVRLVETAPLLPETWSGVADFYGALKPENQRGRVYSLEGVSVRPEDNLEPEDVLQIRALEISTRVDPNGIYCWDSLGELSWALGLRALALECYREAMTLLPDPAKHLFLGAASMPPVLVETVALGMERAAAKPRSAEPEMVYRNLGIFLMEQERYAEARRAFEKADASAVEGSYLSWQAWAAANEGKDEDAIRLHRLALSRKRLDPEDRFRNHLSLGQMLEKRGRYEEAARDLRAALNFRPRDPRALLLLGRVDEAMGRLDEAEELYVKAADSSQERITPLVNLVEFYRRVGRPAEAMVPARKLMDLQPDEQVYRRLVQQLSAEIDGRVR